MTALLVLGGALGAGLLHRQEMDARLVRAFPDRAEEDPQLVRFAMARAKPIYLARCAACHGADMRGDPRTGAANLIDADWLFGSGRTSDIEQTILYGVRAGSPRGRNQADMPAFGRAKPYARYAIPSLSPHELDAVTDYVLALGHRPRFGADIELGRALFRNKAQCFDCHESDGRGDSFIGAPNLTDGFWLYGDGSRDSIRTSIAKGRAGVCPAWLQRLDPAVVRALAILVHQRAEPAKTGARAS
ncbi:MAG TPA: c-type cytochrome [Caulobacteraceae bacterium]|nr:c-type cytochrome [Caulobacteraceae bacterium]